MSHGVNDVHKDILIKQMNEVLRTKPNARCFVKWTCTRCGDRVTSNVPNVFNTGGYLHEERESGDVCGGVYTGNYYGLAILLVLN